MGFWRAFTGRRHRSPAAGSRRKPCTCPAGFSVCEMDGGERRGGGGGGVVGRGGGAEEGGGVGGWGECENGCRPLKSTRRQHNFLVNGILIPTSFGE